MTEDHQQDGREGLVGSWAASGDFLGAILAGLIIGLLGDRILGTAPLLVVLGIVAGFAVGFWRMYQIAKQAEEELLRRRAERPHP